MTKSEKKAAPAAPPAEPQQSMAAFLQQSCMEISLEVQWFTGSKKVDQNTLAEMLKGYEADADSVSATKRLFSSKHPVIQAANAAKRALVSYVYANSVPAAAVPPAMVTEQQALEFLTKAPGTRYILTAKLDAVMEVVHTLAEELKLAVENVNLHLGEIIEFDKGKLKKLHNVGDYPEKVQASVRVEVKPVQYPLDFETLAPATCKWAREQIAQRLQNSVTVAAGDIAEALLRVTKQIANQLGTRTRLLVPKGHELYKLRDGEVVEILTHDDDESVAAGMRMISVRYDPGTGRNVVGWFGPFSEEEYKALQPYKTEERKKVHESTLQNLRQQLDSFKQVQAMLGDAGKPLGAVVDQLNDVLVHGGTSDEAVLKEMRDSAFFRKQAGQALTQLVGQLQGQMTAIGSRRRTVTKFDVDD